MSKFSIYINLPLYIVLQILLTSLILIKAQQSCPASTKLPNILQFSKTLELVSKSNQNSFNQQFSTVYAAANFQSKPNAVISINGYQFSGVKNIDYRLSSQVNDTKVSIKFMSNSMYWLSIDIIIWLTARPDLYTGILPIQNLKSGKNNAAVSITPTLHFPHLNEIKSINILTSLSAKSSSTKYSLNCITQSITQTTYQITIIVSQQTQVSFVQFYYVFYNTKSVLFASQGGQIFTSLSIDNSIIMKIDRNFVPIKYFITGFNSFTFTIQKQISKIFDINMKINNNIFQITSSSSITLKIVYLAIGQPISKICNNCQKLQANNPIKQKTSQNSFYVYENSCVKQCPKLSYLHEYENTKICISCSPRIHQTIGSINNKIQCVCQPGYQRNQYNICMIKASQLQIQGSKSIKKLQTAAQITPFKSIFNTQTLNLPPINTSINLPKTTTIPTFSQSVTQTITATNQNKTQNTKKLLGAINVMKNQQPTSSLSTIVNKLNTIQNVSITNPLSDIKSNISNSINQFVTTTVTKTTTNTINTTNGIINNNTFNPLNNLQLNNIVNNKNTTNTSNTSIITNNSMINDISNTITVTNNSISSNSNNKNNNSTGMFLNMSPILTRSITDISTLTMGQIIPKSIATSATNNSNTNNTNNINIHTITDMTTSNINTTNSNKNTNNNQNNSTFAIADITSLLNSSNITHPFNNITTTTTTTITKVVTNSIPTSSTITNTNTNIPQLNNTNTITNTQKTTNNNINNNTNVNTNPLLNNQNNFIQNLNSTVSTTKTNLIKTINTSINNIKPITNSVTQSQKLTDSIVTLPIKPSSTTITTTNTTLNTISNSNTNTTTPPLPFKAVSTAQKLSQSTPTTSNGCLQNQIFNTTSNKCQCNQFSITRADGTCYKCSRSFKLNNACQPCPGFCLQCKDRNSCDKCQDGNIYDLGVRTCVPQFNTRPTTTATGIPTTLSTTTSSSTTILPSTPTSTSTKPSTASPSSSSQFSSFGQSPSTSTSSPQSGSSSSSTDSSFGFSSFDSTFGNFDSGFSSDGSGSFSSSPTTSSTSSTSTASTPATTSTVTNKTTTITSSPSTNTAKPTNSTTTTTITTVTTTTTQNKSNQTQPINISPVAPVISTTSTTINNNIKNNNNTISKPPIVCGQNKIIINSKCVCDSFSIQLQDKSCFKCVPGSYKDGPVCQSCMLNCMDCTASNNCLKCQQDGIFNPITVACQQNPNPPQLNPPPSPATQTPTLVIVKPCNNRSIHYQGTCAECPPPTYKDMSVNEQLSVCLPCTNINPDCITCQSVTKCLTCDYSLEVDSTGKNCVCFTPKHLIDGICKQCPPGLVYTEAERTCIPIINKTTTTPVTNTTNVITGPTVSCGENKIKVNQLCVCDNFSVELEDKSCFRCLQGSYKSGPVCQSCIDFCVNCTSNFNCLTCDENKIFNPNKIACQPKPSSSSSVGCNSRSISFQGQCVECPIPTYKDISNGESNSICLPCTNLHPDCITCQSATKCLTCDNNLQVDLTGKNCACLVPRHLIDGVCKQCPPGFSYIQKGNTCAMNSNTINQTNITTNTTTPNKANTTTTTTITTTTTTIKCGTNQQIQSGKCVCIKNTVNVTGICKFCDPSFFKLGQNCVACPQDCLNCTQFNNCLKCKPNYKFNALDRICQFSCPINQVLVNGNCICVQPLVRNTQGVCQKCTSGTIKIGDKCVGCPINCNQCSNAALCTKCSNGFNLMNGGCCRSNQNYNSNLKKCQCNSGFRNISGLCGICPQGLVYVDNIQQCVLTSTLTNTTVTTNTTPIIHQIPICQNNQILSTNNTCICNNKTIRKSNNLCEPCDIGYYISQNNCVACLANCLSCTNSNSCDICQANYTGKNCQNCAQGYTLINSKRCQKQIIVNEVKLCGNGKIQINQLCDDGNNFSGDGCSNNCSVQNGYICKQLCTQLLIKTSQSITSTGIFSQYRYVHPQTANNVNLQSYLITNGQTPSNIKIIRPVNDPTLVKVFIDYCGLLPQQNITSQFSSNSQLGTFKYVSQYNLITRTAISGGPGKALRETQFLK